jgi:hypothetical protein
MLCEASFLTGLPVSLAHHHKEPLFVLQQFFFYRGAVVEKQSFLGAEFPCHLCGSPSAGNHVIFPILKV